MHLGSDVPQGAARCRCMIDTTSQESSNLIINEKR